jgi:hypothetical protein
LELRARFQIRKWQTKASDGPDTATKEDDGMNEAAKAQAEAIFKRREMERAEFEAQLQAQRDKSQRLVLPPFDRTPG